MYAAFMSAVCRGCTGKSLEAGVLKSRGSVGRGEYSFYDDPQSVLFVGSECETYFLSPRWRLKIGGGFQISDKLYIPACECSLFYFSMSSIK